MGPVSSASAPLRLSLAGGGTDLPEHYRQWGCHLLALALDQRVHVEVALGAEGQVEVRTPDGTWSAPSTQDLGHIEIAAALEAFGITSGVCVRVRSAVASGSGLGGSGAMLVALVGALSAWQGRLPAPAPAEVAALAFDIERNRAARPVGHQDHVVAAHGGLVRLRIEPGGSPETVRDEHLFACAEAMLDRELLLFRTPLRRASASVLTQQTSRMESGAANAGMAALGSLVDRFDAALRARSVHDLGDLLDQPWEAKRAATPATSTPQIDEWYEQARAAGALGGKIVGAGGGGFLLFAVPDAHRDRLQYRLHALGLQRLPVRAAAEGLRIHQPPSTSAAATAATRPVTHDTPEEQSPRP